jgi:hypothetical protein
MNKRAEQPEVNRLARRNIHFVKMDVSAPSPVHRHPVSALWRAREDKQARKERLLAELRKYRGTETALSANPE